MLGFVLAGQTRSGRGRGGAAHVDGALVLGPDTVQHPFDIGLDKGTEDDEYLTTLEQALTMVMRQFQPDAIIYDAGVDVHVNDDLGHLHISTQGVYERDTQVFALAERLGVPIAAVIGGGYQRDIAALVDVHIQLYRAAGVIN